jgi:hypothetical protein
MTIGIDDLRDEPMPGGEDQSFDWCIVRADEAKPILLIALSDKHWGTRTHFFKGRTMPCLKTDCEACKRKMLSRWTGYLLCLENKTGTKIIFEFTPPGALVLQKARNEYTTLRGLNIIASRPSRKANGKVLLEIRGMNSGAHKLPPAPDAKPLLMHIWGLADQDIPEYAEFTPDGLAEAERVQHAMEQVPPADENSWMHARASDLAGQIILPLDCDVRSSNGKH